MGGLFHNFLIIRQMRYQILLINALHKDLIKRIQKLLTTNYLSNNINNGIPTMVSIQNILLKSSIVYIDRIYGLKQLMEPTQKIIMRPLVCIMTVIISYERKIRLT